VFESRVLKTIFGTVREEVRGGWKKLFKKEHYGNFCLPNNIRRENQGTRVGATCGKVDKIRREFYLANLKGNITRKTSA
jgi:hypothetical protein